MEFYSLRYLYFRRYGLFFTSRNLPSFLGLRWSWLFCLYRSPAALAFTYYYWPLEREEGERLE